MAHFAKLDTNNVVLSVVTLKDDKCPTEEEGRAYLESIHKCPIWKQTSYNTHRNTHNLGGTPFRGNFASIGGTYDPDNNVFIDPKPYASWVLNNTDWGWDPPIAYPTEGVDQPAQDWNEETQSWILTTPE